MNITTPIEGLDSFKVLTREDGTTLRLMLKEVKRGAGVVRPGAGEAAVSALNLDFVIRAQSHDDAVQLIESVWG